jgi:hypothetical protein
MGAILVLHFFDGTALVLAPLEQLFLPKIIAASTWKNSSCPTPALVIGANVAATPTSVLFYVEGTLPRNLM